MTSIDTYEARKYWGEKGKSEIDFLKAIQFVAFNDNGRISLIADEEGNNEIVLTPESARWLASQLVRMADEKESGCFMTATFREEIR